MIIPQYGNTIQLLTEFGASKVAAPTPLPA